jgi:hypothetical protein
MAHQAGPRPIHVDVQIDSPVFDAAQLAGLQRLLPPVRLHAYLKELDRQFLFISEGAVSDLEIGHQAHKIVSQAGMLGLTRMANCAANLENACRSGKGREAALLACRGAVGDVRDYAMPAAGASAD